jgi:hypothetical protein
LAENATVQAPDAFAPARSLLDTGRAEVFNGLVVPAAMEGVPRTAGTGKSGLTICSNQPGFGTDAASHR